MSRNIITGSLILLVITAVAVIWHNIDQESLRALLRNPLEIATPPHFLAGRNDHLSLFPEQKFLISGPIDLNTATEEELEAIPRIGPFLARKIIDFRTEHGEISTLDTLLEVKGIGPRILETIRPYIRAD